ncbi:circadian clock KaiB family protein [bacterium]|nr:circadian clock KaiB family protein [bacterium]
MNHFRLYVTGQNPVSIKAIEKLNHILKFRLADRYSLEVIDILDNPKMAEEDEILATPSVIKLDPPPRRRIIGSLDDEEKVLVALGLIGEK